MLPDVISSFHLLETEMRPCSDMRMIILNIRRLTYINVVLMINELKLYF